MGLTLALIAGAAAGVVTAEPVAAWNGCGVACEPGGNGNDVLAYIKKAAKDDRFTAKEIDRVEADLRDLDPGQNPASVLRLMTKADNDAEEIAKKARRIANGLRETYGR